VIHEREGEGAEGAAEFDEVEARYGDKASCKKPMPAWGKAAERKGGC